jgi:hypothetical protein
VYLKQFLPGKLTFCCRVLKSVAYVALVRKEDDEIRITILRNKKVNALVVTDNKLTYNFVGLVTGGLWPDLARGKQVGPRRIKLYV